MTELKGWRGIPIGGMILEAGNSVEYKTGGWRAFRPVFGDAACSHCMLCWLFCPDSCILVDPEAEAMTGFDLDYCKGCGICAAECPVNQRVIRIAKRTGEAVTKDDPRLCIRMIEEGRIEEGAL